MTGKLYIVATPIGNLEDMTYRAVRILREADVIAAEDTRHSRKLLTHFGISGTMTSYFDHNKSLKGESIIRMLLQGRTVALISDAGTPCVSDPGYQLVRDALANGIDVIPVPGCCAAIAALSASGFPSDRFTFAGFPPSKEGKRREFLKSLAMLPGTLILYEAPHRLQSTLLALREVMGDRTVTVARELTKIYEEFTQGEAAELLDRIADEKLRGEIVILVAPGSNEPTCQEDPSKLLHRLVSEGMSVRDAAKQVSELTGISRSELYDMALSIRKNEPEA